MGQGMPSPCMAQSQDLGLIITTEPGDLERDTTSVPSGHNQSSQTSRKNPGNSDLSTHYSLNRHTDTLEAYVPSPGREPFLTHPTCLRRLRVMASRLPEA